MNRENPFPHRGLHISLHTIPFIYHILPRYPHIFQNSGQQALSFSYPKLISRGEETHQLADAKRFYGSLLRMIIIIFFPLLSRSLRSSRDSDFSSSEAMRVCLYTSNSTSKKSSSIASKRFAKREENHSLQSSDELLPSENVFAILCLRILENWSMHSGVP